MSYNLQSFPKDSEFTNQVFTVKPHILVPSIARFTFHITLQYNIPHVIKRKKWTSVHTISKTADDVTSIFSTEPTELHLNSPACCTGQLEERCFEALHLRTLGKLLILNGSSLHK